MHFEFALGGFDSSIYCPDPEDLIPADEETLNHRMLAIAGAAAAQHSTNSYLEHNVDDYEDVTCMEGKIFLIIFNSVNMILLLNLIIAILSSTYAFFEDKKIGLYYETLVGKFAKMEFDDRYGSAACAQPPMNLMVFPV